MMILDTSGLFCLHYPLEPFHAQTVRWFEDRSVKVTHNYVLSEFVALINARSVRRETAWSFLRDIQDSPEVEVIWVGEALHNRALSLLRNRLDKSWSLCDAVSFVIMEERGISEALTNDHHFEQAGFIRLLK